MSFDKRIHDAIIRAAHRGTTFDAVLCGDLEATEKRIEELERALGDFAEMVEREVRIREQSTRGGQHVPNHGDLCSAPPSVMSRMQWWARMFRSLLAERKENGNG